MWAKALSCGMVLAIMLSGCGDTTTPVSETGIPPPSSSSSSTRVAVSDIGMSHDEIVGLIDSRNGRNGYATIAQSKISEAVAETASGDEYLCTRYILQEGIAIYFWTSPDTLAIRQFTFEADTGSLTPSGAELSGYICASLPFFFEPDDYEQLTSELKILLSDISDNVTVEKTERTYIYNNHADKESFTVIPPQSNVLAVDNYSFVDVVVSMSIDSYLGKLLPSMDSGGFDITTFEQFKVDDSEPGYVGRKYSLGVGADILLFESKDTGEIDEIYLGCNVLEAEESAVKNFGFIASASIIMFECENREAVNADIRISDVKKNAQRFTRGNDFEYLYVIDSGRLGLTMVRRNSERYNRILNSDTTSSSSPSASVPSDERVPPVAIELQPDEPTFTGGTCLASGIDLYNGGPPVVTTEFSESDTVYFSGVITGITGQQNLIITWIFPNGTVQTFTLYGNKNNDNANSGMDCYGKGFGEGTITVTMESTGEVIGVYNYTVM